MDNNKEIKKSKEILINLYQNLKIRKLEDITKQIEKLRIPRKIKIKWTNDTIDNEFLTSELSERCHKRKKTPKKQKIKKKIIKMMKIKLIILK